MSSTTSNQNAIASNAGNSIFNSLPSNTIVTPTKPFYPTPTGQPMATPKPAVTTPPLTITLPDPKIDTQSTTTLSSNKTADIANAQATTAKFATGGVITDPTSGIATTANGTAYTPFTPAVPAGWDTQTYQNFKTANPGIEPTTQDTNAMNNAGKTNTGGYVGETYYAPGSTIPTDNIGNPMKMTATSPSQDTILKSLSDQKASSDALTAEMVANIESQYQTLTNHQQQVNASNNAATAGAIFRSGAAQGDAYAQNAQNYQIQQGVDALADLATKKQTAILAAKQAGQTQDFQLQEKMNSQIADIAKDQAAAGKALSEKIQAATDLAKTARSQAVKDTAVADIYKLGTTDVPGILAALKLKGITDVTAKDISDTLKNIIPAGLDDLVKTLRTNGAPQDVIVKVLASPDINSAYQAAGNYGAGGTGIIGEYNYYRAQAEAAGQTPMDFNAYQNMDANRKIKIAAAANAAGLTSTATNTALKLSDDYEQRSKDYYSQREAFNRIQSSANDPSPAGDLALIFNYMKVLDPNSTVREGEFANAENAGSAFNAIGAQYNKVVNGQRLTEKQRADFIDRSSKLFEGAKKQQDVVVDEFKTRAKQYGVPDNLVVRDTSATGSNAADAVETEDQATTDVTNYVIANPNTKDAITKMIADGIPYLKIKATLNI